MSATAALIAREAKLVHISDLRDQLNVIQHSAEEKEESTKQQQTQATESEKDMFIRQLQEQISEMMTAEESSEAGVAGLASARPQDASKTNEQTPAVDPWKPAAEQPNDEGNARGGNAAMSAANASKADGDLADDETEKKRKANDDDDENSDLEQQMKASGYTDLSQISKTRKLNWAWTVVVARLVSWRSRARIVSWLSFVSLVLRLMNS